MRQPPRATTAKKRDPFMGATRSTTSRPRCLEPLTSSTPKVWRKVQQKAKPKRERPQRRRLLALKRKRKLPKTRVGKRRQQRPQSHSRQCSGQALKVRTCQSGSGSSLHLPQQQYLPLPPQWGPTAPTAVPPPPSPRQPWAPQEQRHQLSQVAGPPRSPPHPVLLAPSTVLPLELRPLPLGPHPESPDPLWQQHCREPWPRQPQPLKL
mmetsp:Transcript_77823/g.170426  ORF Transcript_77823/g.170426 Transcript_77823/m.170426 type:complete len:208 (-) Transcript_77823:327-950(-)